MTTSQTSPLRELAIIRRLDDIGALSTARRIEFKHGIDLETIVGRCRHGRVVRARHHLCALLTWTLDLSYSDVGRIMALDHTSVINAVRTHEEKMTKEGTL